MRRLFVALCLCLTASTPAFSYDNKADQGWLPVTPQDWQVKEVPYNPGAGAIQLYFSYYKDDNDSFRSAYYRIKVLTEAGKEYAQVEIEIAPGESLQQLKARTLHPDGTVIEFEGKALEKTVLKARGIKYVAKTFAFPDVTVGSIIEYRYTVAMPRHVVDPISKWPIQHPLFTVKEHLRFRAYQGLVRVPTEGAEMAPRSRVSYSYLNQVDARLPEKKQGNLMELDLENVPAFTREEYMPPEDDFKPSLLFYYGGRETASPEQFWEDWRKVFTEYVEKFIGTHKEVNELAASLTGSETDAERKLRKLYTRVQQIRNLSYERERTDEEAKKEGLKANGNVVDVLQRGYGTSVDINRLFVALARAAGFEAYPLRVSDRKQRSFQKILLWLGQLDSEAALVKVNGKDVVLEPGTKYCPYGLIRWMHTSATALRLAKAGDPFIITPPPQGSVVHRIARIRLAADGSAKGEITIEFTGEDALERRLQALDTDEAGRRKSLEDEMQASLPNGSTVQLLSSEGWNTEDAPLAARFTVEIANLAVITGKRMLEPAYLFAPFEKRMFASQVRRYPIVLSYPFVEQDEFSTTLPGGYSLEVAPYRRKATLAYGGYEISNSLEDNQLTVKRNLRLDRSQFSPDDYQQLSEFFDIVHAGDGEQAVFQTASSTEKRP